MSARTGKSKDNLRLRDARPGELDEVALLLKEAYQQYEPDVPPERWQEYVADMMDVRSRRKEAQIIVAEVDGRLAGTVTLYLNRPQEAENWSWPEGWAGVRLLGVRPGYRGRGIGRVLMEECLRRCRDKGIRTIALHTARLMDVAMRLYERMGFKRAPEFDFQPRPELVVMAYRLDL